MSLFSILSPTARLRKLRRPLQLQSLGLEQSRLTDLGLERLLANCDPTLRRLNLSGTPLTGEPATSRYDWKALSRRSLLNHMIKFSGNLRKNLKSSPSIVSDLPSFPNLEELNLSDCPNLTDRGLSRILSSCGSSLRRLNLSGTSLPATEVNLPSGLPQLEELDLSYCNGLEDKGLVALLRLCPCLRRLNLASTSISGEGLYLLTEARPSLSFLNLNSTLLCDQGPLVLS